MPLELTKEQQQALDDQQGFVQGPTYVLITKDVFRNAMGIESEDELEASLAAIQRAMEDFAVGRSISLEEARRRMGG
jgi:hypothetical protein